MREERACKARLLRTVEAELLAAVAHDRLRHQQVHVVRILVVAALELDGAFEEHARGDAEEEVDEVVMVCWEAEGVAHESDSDSDDGSPAGDGRL